MFSALFLNCRDSGADVFLSYSEFLLFLWFVDCSTLLPYSKPWSWIYSYQVIFVVALFPRTDRYIIFQVFLFPVLLLHYNFPRAQRVHPKCYLIAYSSTTYLSDLSIIKLAFRFRYPHQLALRELKFLIHLTLWTMRFWIITFTKDYKFLQLKGKSEAVYYLENSFGVKYELSKVIFIFVT